MADCKLPIDTSLFIVAGDGPVACLLAKLIDVADAAMFQALTCHGTEFVFRNVEPASVFGSESKIETTDKFPRWLAGKAS